MDLKIKARLNSLYGTCAAGEYPAPRFTNNSRKMAGLPMFRKGKARCRKYRGFRNPGAEALQALMETWNADYIDTDTVNDYIDMRAVIANPHPFNIRISGRGAGKYMVGGYHRGKKMEV